MCRSLVRRARYASAALLCLSIAQTARAQQPPRDPAAAESLFRSAREAVGRGDYATACPQFAESQRLDPAPGTLMNLADCEEHMGKLASAWEHFLRAKEQLRPGDDRIPYAEQHVAALEPRLPHLVVKLKAGAPAGTKVLRDQVTMGAASLGVRIAVDPGAHTLAVVAPERVPSKQEITLREGETREIELEPGAPERAQWPTVTESKPQGQPEAPAPPADDGGRRTMALVIGGIGVAGLAAGAVTGLMAFSAAGTYKDNCNQTTGACQSATGVDAASSGKTLSTISTVSFLVGAAGVGAGAYLWLTSGSNAPRAAVGVAPLPGGGSFGVVGRF